MQQFQDLINILGQELALFTELRDLLTGELKFIKTFDADKLAANVKAKQTLELRLKILEQARLETIAALSQGLGLDGQEVTLKDLAQHAPSGQREKIVKLQKVFKRLADEVKNKVETNARLVDSSLRLIYNLQRIIINAVEEPTTYQRAGQINGPDVVVARTKRRI